MHARRSFNFISLLILAITLSAVVGCASKGVAPLDGVSYWVPSSVESFATIDNDTLYAVVADETHDVYIREIEVDDETLRAWIVRVRRVKGWRTARPARGSTSRSSVGRRW